VRHGWQLDVTGYVQADSVAWSQDSLDELDVDGEPLNQERFLIRRGRLRAEAHKDQLFAALELDGNTVSGATARLLGAQVGWTLRRPAFDVTVSGGLFKIPFGVEVPASERDKAFLEAPAFARALFPGNYDGGVMAQGSYGIARVAVAATNGAPVGDAQWKGVDPTGSYDFVGRVGAEVDAPYRWRIDVGVSALVGTGLHPGTPPTKDELQWIDDNENGRVELTELRIVPGTPGEPSETYKRNALGADAQVHWCLCAVGNGTAFFEGVIATNLDRGLVYSDPIATSRDLRQAGFAIGAVQDIGPYAQLGVRYDRYDADRDASEQEGIDLVQTHKIFSTLSVMAGGRWHDARVLVQFDHERNPFGRGDDGMPLTRSADRVTLRGQVGF